ncbi:Eag protein [Vibrio splendidus]|uniref:Eag protein n=1 Tax=Vibrio splendidus TaxID=29497 RepID=A0A2T5DVY4_VIBSP|nr:MULTISPECIES: hypothetical protein [Vibrio]PTP10700.1 Eag protein [Vibrio splendidus]TCT62848.1 hypothetical protein EDB31_13562 [Vibrio crassostreae]
MARARKAECPECGCTNIGKERMFGVQTGDYVCRECGHTSTPPEFHDAFERSEADSSESE